MISASNDVTGLLLAWGNGDKMALEQLMPLVYDQLHRLASRHLNRERRGSSLQTTALIHEAYIRLVDQRKTRWQNRAHFFAIAARLMRRILVDQARARTCSKRGGFVRRISLVETEGASDRRAAEVTALEDALESLFELDPRKGKVVELRYFGGLTIEETSEVLGISPNTVIRDWCTAKAWLHREMSTRAENRI